MLAAHRTHLTCSAFLKISSEQKTSCNLHQLKNHLTEKTCTSAQTSTIINCAAIRMASVMEIAMREQKEAAQESKYVIPPSNAIPDIDSSDWPLLLKDYDKSMSASKCSKSLATI